MSAGTCCSGANNVNWQAAALYANSQLTAGCGWGQTSTWSPCSAGKALGRLYCPSDA
jgi:hypothetical protein